MQDNKLERIAKVIARRGFCSRREAEQLIFQGDVYIDGVAVESPSLKISYDAEITISGKLVPKKEELKLWAFYKPKNCITSYKDPQGRPTVFSMLPNDIGRVVSVGRLDYSTEGLLLMSNDGEVKRVLELPSSKIARIYKCKVYGIIPRQMQKMLSDGVNIDGVYYAPVKLVVEQSKGKQHWIEMELTEGKNREIRRICEYFGLEVSRLIRIKYGNVSLDGMSPKELRQLTYHEVKKLIPDLL